MAEEGENEGLKETEEEEELITLEIEDHEFSELTLPYSLIGLETDTPILKLGNKVYQGQYQYVVGTHLFFDQSQGPNGVSTSYAGKTQKKIVFKPIWLQPKEKE
mmetsp:Transcript_7412/g.11663  ORF Transcript_7412/g.11663 Transcript_7412/m.11663 type:complete len:104 (+) Transcript_7412:263-574(+)|eukprot:CAMPEP_0184300460 /NCGR_PEP_ID=MMETSP1049-20130417/10862_1 /TAXON_ID=77928 /ORGANISM="Proteomonas sulcata, Strain CCMP704" /LENGTH=103 /DNA_ID=CAMNT_0026611179 /DNA_START=249 /DNA_END=560 /DNA_ORIENTATION=+